jgi:hypothetical protein
LNTPTLFPYLFPQRTRGTAIEVKRTSRIFSSFNEESAIAQAVHVADDYIILKRTIPDQKMVLLFVNKSDHPVSGEVPFEALNTSFPFQPLISAGDTRFDDGHTAIGASRSFHLGPQSYVVMEGTL